MSRSGWKASQVYLCIGVVGREVSILVDGVTLGGEFSTVSYQKENAADSHNVCL